MIQRNDKEVLVNYVHHWRMPKFKKNLSTSLSWVYLSRLAYLASFIKKNGEPQFADYHPEEGCAKIENPVDIIKFLNISNTALMSWWTEMEGHGLIVKHEDEYAINENYFYIGDMPGSVRERVEIGAATVCPIPKWLLRELYYKGLNSHGFDLGVFLKLAPCMNKKDRKLYLPEIVGGSGNPLKTFQANQLVRNQKISEKYRMDEDDLVQDFIHRLTFTTVGTESEMRFLYRFEDSPFTFSALKSLANTKSVTTPGNLLWYRNVMSGNDFLQLKVSPIIINPSAYRCWEVKAQNGFSIK